MKFSVSQQGLIETEMAKMTKMKMEPTVMERVVQAVLVMEFVAPETAAQSMGSAAKEISIVQV